MEWHVSDCTNNQTNTLSIVIIGKNAAWSIGRLLDSILAHIPTRIVNEIVYVDSASTDDSVEIARRYPVKVACLSSNQYLCASAGRYVGAKHATGKYILFVDSDMKLLNGWLERALEVLDRHQEIAVVSGIEVNIDSAQPPDGGALLSERPRFSDIKYAGNAAVFRHSVLDTVGTWNPYIISDEEPELCLRIRSAGFRVVQLFDPAVYHFCPSALKLSTLLSRRKRRLFIGSGQVIRYHLHTGLLSKYLQERGFALVPALVCVLAIVSVLLSFVFHSGLWVVGFVICLAAVFAADVVRSGSIYKAVFHVAHRMLILEGTLRGLFMPPYPSSGYPCDSPGSVPHCAADHRATA